MLLHNSIKIHCFRLSVKSVCDVLIEEIWAFLKNVNVSILVIVDKKKKLLACVPDLR